MLQLNNSRRENVALLTVLILYSITSEFLKHL